MHAAGADARAGEQAELDSLVAKMKATEARVAQLDERRKCVCHVAQRGGGAD
jgi:cell division protein FtsB